MKGTGRLRVMSAFVAPLLVCVYAQAVEAQGEPTSSASRSSAKFPGRWDLTMEIPSRERPSWLELTEHEGRLEALMVGFWGHATPTGKIQLKDGAIEFSAPEDAGFPEGTLFKARL